MAKEPWEWEEEDLELLISAKTQESISLEYKSTEALEKTDRKKDEISKDVSAFANSAGGVIVYGMMEDRHVPTELDRGYDPDEFPKEWLEQVINSRIQQRIGGVRVKQVALTKKHRGRVAYVVHVPQSNRAPHQASDKRFYKRFNFESQPMEEYEVRDVSRRFDTPDLKIRFSIEGEHHRAQDGNRTFIQFHIRAVISNDAAEPATHAMIYLFRDASISNLQARQHSERTKNIHGAERTVGVRVVERAWKPPEDMPIFLDQAFDVGTYLFHVPSPFLVGHVSFLLGWEIRAPRMGVRTAFTTLDLVNERPLMGDAYATLDEVVRRGVVGGPL